MIVAAVFMLCRPSHATTDQAEAYSLYFSARTATGTSDVDNFYARRWRTWLQFHRAVEETPALRRQLLQLPKDHYDGRKGSRDLMHKKLSAQFVRAQPTNVYILQLGVYESMRGVNGFMKWHWPKVARKSIYDKSAKDFRVGFSSEANTKSEPIFLLSGKLNARRVWRLCYGIYASNTDAKRDAAQFKRHLGYSPVILQRPLTAQLARSFIFEPIAGRQP